MLPGCIITQVFTIIKEPLSVAAQEDQIISKKLNCQCWKNLPFEKFEA
jgi:hypothetical protein